MRGQVRRRVVHAGGGRRDETLEEAGREMSAASGSRERDSAGPAGGRKLGWGCGPGAEGRACGVAQWTHEAKPAVLALRTRGLVGLQFCGDVVLSRHEEGRRPPWGAPRTPTL